MRAVVVGSGPNGLAGAIVLAKAGLEVKLLEGADRPGGGVKSEQATVPGLLHDCCSAFYPFGIGSRVLRELDLARHGLRWGRFEIDLAHPLLDGECATLSSSVSATAERLGVDGDRWTRVFSPLVDGFEALIDELMAPPLHRPSRPGLLARILALGGLPASSLARLWRLPPTRALFAGAVAHGMSPFSQLGSSAIGLALLAAGQRWGWPVPVGGAQALTDALLAEFTSSGGVIECGHFVSSIGELGEPEVVLLDLMPRGVVELAGDRLPPGMRRTYERYRHGPGVFKVDLAVEGAVPWRHGECRRAGTIHLGGDLHDVAEAERCLRRGRLPRRPFVLVGQQYLADPGRTRNGTVPVWAYAQVPSGYPFDVTDAVLNRIEEFAPGVRDRIVALHTRSPRELSTGNPNYVGGDVIGGSNTPWQLLARPGRPWSPYCTGIPGVFICSAATPPGGGVHGMGGFNAAALALRRLGVPFPALGAAGS